MTISAIIPTCDRLHYLKEAIDSILRQTRLPDEIIIVNNGKVKIELPHAIMDKVKIYDITPYSGAAKARNFGVKMAKSVYVAFLDDDDLWAPCYLEKIYPHIINGESCIVSRLDKMVGGKAGHYKNPEGRLTVENFLVYNPGFGGTNLVILRKLFLEMGGFDDDLPTSEDKSFGIEILRRGIKIKILPNNQAIARFHEGERLTNFKTIIKGTRKFITKYRSIMSFRQYVLNIYKLHNFEFQSGKRIYFFSAKCLLLLSKALKALNIIGTNLRKIFSQFLPTKVKNSLFIFYTSPFSREKNLFKENIIFFRDDDADELTPRLKKLVEMFIRLEVPLDLAIIPGKVTSETADYLISVKKKYPNIIYYHQHGYTHKNHGIEKKMEFGGGRSYEKQYEDIKEGRELMNKFFNDWENAFTPPHHGYDVNTIKALEELRFDCLSLGAKYPNGNYRIKILPAQVDLMCWQKPYNFKRVRLIRAELKRALRQNKIVGIVSHHEYFSDENFKDLENLIMELKKDLSLSFKNMSRARESY